MTIVRLLAGLTLVFGRMLATEAQTLTPYPPGITHAEPMQRWVVKFAPLSLFDPSNTVQFGLERLLGQHQAVQVEFGYGWQGMNLWRSSQSSRYTDTEIWRGRAEWRYYWRGGPIGSYMALEGLYKQVNAYEHGTIGVGCTTGPCQYYQRYSLPITKHVWGGHLKFGRQFSLMPSNRLLADVYGGLGVRWNTIERASRPDGLSYYQPGGFIVFDPFSSTPYAQISVIVWCQDWVFILVCSPLVFLKSYLKTPKSPEGDFAHSQIKSPSGDLGVFRLRKTNFQTVY